MVIRAVLLEVTSLTAPKASAWSLPLTALLDLWLNFWVFYPAGCLEMTLFLTVTTLVHCSQADHTFRGLRFALAGMELFRR